MLLRHSVWDRSSGDTDRLRTALKKLRARLGHAAANLTYIFNEHGFGYRFARSSETGGRTAAVARRTGSMSRQGPVDW